MIRTIKPWWVRWRDTIEVRRKEVSYLAVSEMMIYDNYPDWNKDSVYAVEIYNQKLNEYKTALLDFKKKWGKLPKVDKVCVMENIIC